MHVSPFLPMDVRVPGHVDRRRATTSASASTSTRDGTPVFDADLALQRVPLDRRRAVACPGPLPAAAAARVSLGIYREALNACCPATRRVYRHPSPAAEGATMSRLARDDPCTPARRPAPRPHPRRDARGRRPIGHRALRCRGEPSSGPDPCRGRPSTTRALYARLLRDGSVGLGESYADGWWDADDLTGFLRLAHRNLARTHPLRDRIAPCR